MFEIHESAMSRLESLGMSVRSHFDRIEQDVPRRSFVVGGAVRDVLLGRNPNDFDFVVVGETPESMIERGFEPIEASSFPVFHDSEHDEWALARTETSDGEGYTDFEVFTDDVSLIEDLGRRDLTINAMALHPDRFQFTKTNIDIGVESEHMETIPGGPVLIDPNGGMSDIRDQVLCHVSDAFAEDPLRVLRVARYDARFPEFHLDSETLDLMAELAPDLALMSRDRIGDEVVKAMSQAVTPSVFWTTLRECGALAVLCPELHRAQLVPAGPEQHHAEGDTFVHTMMVLDRMHELCIEQDLRRVDRVRRLLMALFHDVGKVMQADERGGLHSDDPPRRFGGHDDVSSSVIRTMTRRLGLDGHWHSVICDAVSEHMAFHDLPDMDTGQLLDGLSDRFAPETDVGVVSLPMGAERSSGRREPIRPNFATAWELLDLAHADHEGRLKREHEVNIEFTNNGWSFEVTNEEQFHDDGIHSLSDETHRPEFDRETFVDLIEAVQRVERDVDGFEAMRRGVCDEHIVAADDELQQVLTDCERCRTPGSWIGEEITAMRRARLLDEIR